MLRFFRQVRQRLLTDNKFSKYLLYAVGEILLVVIGILIAIQVDNWNQERENTEKVKAILFDVMVELKENIKETSRVMRFYEKKDSIIFLSITNQLTEENFKNDTPEGLFSVNTYYTTARLSNEAWTKLMDISDVIPSEYKTLVSKINNLYNTQYKFVMRKNDVIIQITDEYIKDLSDNYSWFTPTTSNDGSLKEEIDYRLKSFKHRNRINLWYIHGIQNHLFHTIKYRLLALEVYNELKNTLNTNSWQEEVYFDHEIAKNLNGVWRSNRYPNSEINVRYQEGRLHINFNQDSISRELFDISKNKLNLFPSVRYEDIELESWSGNYSIYYYTVMEKNGELILKDYFSEWYKVNE